MLLQVTIESTLLVWLGVAWCLDVWLGSGARSHVTRRTDI